MTTDLLFQLLPTFKKEIWLDSTAKLIAWRTNFTKFYTMMPIQFTTRAVVLLHLTK